MEGSILVIARDNLALTKNAVRSMLGQTVPCTVLVIDNDSRDGTRNWLKTKTTVAWSSTITQKSLAACWNMGLRALFASGASEVLVCNNDVQLSPTTYEKLTQLNKPFVTAVSVNNLDQMQDFTLWGADLLATARPHPDFSCFMIRKEVISKVGWFDESYFPAYCEDCDYHVRMHRAGIEAVCVSLPFYHAAAQTLQHASPVEAQRIRHGADINRARFQKKYGCLPGTPEYEKLFAQASLV